MEDADFGDTLCTSGDFEEPSGCIHDSSPVRGSNRFSARGSQKLSIIVESCRMFFCTSHGEATSSNHNFELCYINNSEIKSHDMNDARQQSAHVSLHDIVSTFMHAARKYPLSGTLVFVLYGISLLTGGVLTKLIYRNMFDLIASSVQRSMIWPQLSMLLLILSSILVISFLCSRAADFLITYSQSNTIRDLENYAAKKLLQHSYIFFTGSFAGSLVAKVRRFSRSFESLYDQTIFIFWFIGIQLLGILIVLAFILPLLAAFFLAWCVLYLLISYAFERYHLRYDLKRAENESAVTGQLSDIITNFLNIKIFSSGHEETKRFESFTDRLARSRSLSWNVSNVFHAFQGFAMTVLEAGGMWITLNLWSNGTISAGTVVLVQSYLLMVIAQTWNIGRGLRETFRALADAEEMVAVIRMPLEVQDPPSPEASRIVKGEILFDKVNFGYEDNRDVFSDFSLEIPAGQRVGIVGHSGSGKSTLFKMLLRFVDVRKGAITIDGQDVRSITQDDLHRSTSYVPQEPVLFHRSLFENIAYAKPSATREEIIAAAQKAHAHEFIIRLPQGYDTLVGERGIKLSGGERQRVAIARIILKYAPILLLDEATSSLDSLSERYIQEQLLALMESRTTLAIAHRISTITHMDRIIVLEDGRIVEDGTHEALLLKGGRYAELWQHQSHGFLVPENGIKSR